MKRKAKRLAVLYQDKPFQVNIQPAAISLRKQEGQWVLAIAATPDLSQQFHIFLESHEIECLRDAITKKLCEEVGIIQ